MSDIHILEYDQKSIVRCVFHIAIPEANNAVGISYRSALVQHLGGASAIGSVLPDSGEVAGLQAGSLLEVSETVRFSSINLTDAQRLQQVRAAYNARKDVLIAELQERLLFYGYSGTVA